MEDIKKYFNEKARTRFKERADAWDWLTLEDEYMEMYWEKLCQMLPHPAHNVTREIMSDNGFWWEKEKQCFINKDGKEFRW